MPINRQIREKTQRVLGCRRAAYYSKVDEVHKRYGTITREEAGYVLAAEAGLDLTKYLDGPTCSKIMDIRSKAPVQAPVILTERTPRSGRRPGNGKAPPPQKPHTQSGGRQCGRKPRDVMRCVHLDPRVLDVSGKLYRDGHFAEAVEESLKLFNDSAKAKAGRPKGNGGVELDGASLMRRVFSRDQPILRVNSLRTDSDKNEQEGYMHIAAGAMTGLRNPRAHQAGREDDSWRALELLVFASHLMWMLDRAKRVRPRATRSRP